MKAATHADGLIQQLLGSNVEICPLSAFQLISLNENLVSVPARQAQSA